MTDYVQVPLLTAVRPRRLTNLRINSIASVDKGAGEGL